MKVIHLISGGDSGGAKTHVLSLLQHLNQTITAQLVCFRDGPFAEEARQMGIPTDDHARATTSSASGGSWRPISARAAMSSSTAMAPGPT